MEVIKKINLLNNGNIQVIYNNNRVNVYKPLKFIQNFKNILKEEYEELRKIKEEKTIQNSDKSILELIKEYANNSMYELCYMYNILGILEFKKINKTSITCIDSTNKKHYLKLDKINNLYKENLILLYK